MTRFKTWLLKYLEVEDILLEIIFGLLIVMTFTLAIRAADAASFPLRLISDNINTLFAAAIGCTIAWGIIDAIITILTNVAERGRRVRLIEKVQAETSDKAKMAIVSGELDDAFPDVFSQDELDDIYLRIAQRARKLTVQPEGMKREDLIAAVIVVSCALVATLPALVPMLFVSDPGWAIRICNLIAIFMLYVVGYQWAKYAGGKRVKTGLLLAGIGLIMMAIAIPMGG